MQSKKEAQKIEKLLKDLCSWPTLTFPTEGGFKDADVPTKHGVYIIYNPKKLVVHVGQALSGKNGLRQRLSNHLYGQSSFARQHLKGHGEKLRLGYKFRFIEISDSRERALLENLAIGKLCPKHLG